MFKIIRQIFSNYPEYKDKIEIGFAGYRQGWLDQMVSDFELNSIVRFYGFLEKSEVLDFQRTQDFLLLTSSKRFGKKDYSIAGKTFDYLSQMKPILAIVTDGAQREILNNLGCAIILDPDKTHDSSKVLLDILRNGCILKPKYKNIDKHLTENALRPVLKLIK